MKIAIVIQCKGQSVSVGWGADSVIHQVLNTNQDLIALLYLHVVRIYADNNGISNALARYRANFFITFRKNFWPKNWEF